LEANTLKRSHLSLFITLLSSTLLQKALAQKAPLYRTPLLRDPLLKVPLLKVPLLKDRLPSIPSPKTIWPKVWRWLAPATLTLLVSTPLQAVENFAPDEALRAEAACIQLGDLYANYLDTGQYALVPTLFAPQGSFHGQAGKYTGRESVAMVFNRIDKNQRSIHVVSNQMVEIQSRNLVIVTSYFTTYQTDKTTGVATLQAQPVRIGRYTDECVRGDDGWLFQSRVMDVIFGQQTE
jgi:hypothetical protein